MKAVTGSALQMPYAEYHRQYEIVPLFAFQSLAEEPTYNHAALKKFFTASAGRGYRARQSLAGVLNGWWANIALYGGFIVGWSFTIIGLGVLLVLKDRRVRFALACSILFLVVLNLETFGIPHYTAPFLACGVFLWTRGLQALWEWRGGIPALRIALVILVATGMGMHAVEARSHAKHRASYDIYRRPKIIEWLESHDGDHLVIVRYARNHNPNLEWVQNGADLEGARVIWAREMDRERTAALIREFPERTPWLLRADRKPKVMERYEVEPESSALPE